MKRKLFNAALFGAVLIAAPVSTFVSCADYDSDITNLNDLLNKEVTDLQGLVAQKEAAIQQKIDELKAQEAALEAADKTLDDKLEACKKSCDAKQAELEQKIVDCKTECAAAQANLKASIDALEAALNAAKELEGSHYAELLEADKILTQGLTEANARIDDIVNNRIPALKTELQGYVDNELQQVYQSFETLQQTLSSVYNQLTDLETSLNAKIDEVSGNVAALKSKLEADIAGNAAAILAANEALDAHKAEFNTYKTGAAAELEQVKAALEGKASAAALAALETLVNTKASQADLNALAEKVAKNGGDIHDLVDALASVKDDVAKNTKGLASLAARITDLETDIAEHALQLSALKVALDAAVAAQEEVDAAQDLAIEQLKLNLAQNYYDKSTTDGKLDALQTALNTLIETKYNAAIAHADQLLVQAQNYTDTAVNALHTQIGEEFRAWVEQSLNPALGDLQEGQVTLQNNIDAVDAKFANYYTKGAIDEFVAALEAADAKRDADFQAWVEQVLNPGLAELNAAIEKNADDIKANAAAIVTNQLAIAANREAIVANEAAFREWIEVVLNPGLAALQGQITTCSLAIGKNAEDIAANKKAIEDNAAAFRAWVETELNPAMAEVTNKINKNIADIATNKANLEKEVQDRINALTSLHATIGNEFRTWVEQTLNPALAEISGDIDGLKTRVSNLEEADKALSAEVKGFVLEPASYYEGIQAIEGTSYEYHTWDVVTDPKSPTMSTDVTTYCPEVIAHYHVNPSEAKLSEQVAQYKYAVLDRKNRGVNTELQPVITKVHQNGGMLDVTMSLTNPKANLTPQGHMDPSDVTVMALQYTNPAAKAANQVVTSDYAVLYLNPLTDVSLKDAVDHHDIGAAAEFSEKDYVAYNTTKPYDIEANLKTSFGGEDPVARTDSKWPEGFTYKYTVVEGDQMYFNLDTEKGTAMPQLPNGQPATTACVGKYITVRIDVMHEGEVAEVGFYTLTITGEAIIETSDPTSTDEVRALTCIDDKVVLEKELPIQKIWDLIVYKTGEDLATVQGKYAVTTSEDGNVKQFDTYTSEDNRELYRGIAGKGTITLVNNTTIKWVVKNNDPALTESIHAKGDKLVTYIRVRSIKQIGKDTYNEFYIPVVWEPSDVEVWDPNQTATWNYTKVTNQWQTNNTTKGETYNANELNELRLYADLNQPGVAPFHYDLIAKAMKNVEDVTLDAPANAFINHEEFEVLTEKHFRFIEHPNAAARTLTVDGVVYNMTVNATGTELLANGTMIATITPAGVIDLNNNTVTKKLLNAFENIPDPAYGNMLCARVGYSVKSCGGPVKVKNGDFDVRFIKPVTFVENPIVIADTEGHGGAIEVDFLKNLICFNGYNFGAHEEYFGVFGVQIEIPTPENWQTDYDGRDINVVDGLKNTLTGTGMEENFSVNTDDPENPIIKYINNTAVVSEFKVAVPVTLTYVWGDEQKYNVILVVGRTTGNSKRK